MKATKPNLIIVPVGLTIDHFIKLHNVDFDVKDHWRNTNNERNYDILAVQYGDFVPEDGTYDVSMKATGNKWKIIKELSKTIDFSQWEYIGAYDDDVITSSAAVSYCFKFAKENSVGAYQQALFYGSESNWPITRLNTEYAWVETDFMEIMCPVFTKENFIKLLDLLNSYDANHGWGLDFIFKDYFGCNIGIFHFAPMLHPSRPNTGSSYTKQEAFKEMDLLLKEVYPKLRPNYISGSGQIITAHKKTINTA